MNWGTETCVYWAQHGNMWREHGNVQSEEYTETCVLGIVISISVGHRNAQQRGQTKICICIHPSRAGTDTCTKWWIGA